MESSHRIRLLSRLLFVVAGTAVGIALLVSLLRSVNLTDVAGAFSGADYIFLVPAFLLFFINLLVKVPRWSLLFGDDAPDWNTLFAAMTVGYAVNTLLPARLGEVVRAYWVRDRAGVGMVKTLSTIALERVLDGVTLLVIILAIAPTVALPRVLFKPALTVGVTFTLVLIGMAVAVYNSHQGGLVDRLLHHLETGRLAVAGRMCRQVIAGLQVLRRKREIGLVLGMTAIVWGSNALLTWVVLLAFHVHVPLSAGILLTAVLNLGMAVPSSPGYVGVFEYLMILTLGLFGIARDDANALAATLALHAITFGTVTLIGLVYLFARLGAAARMIRTAASQ